MKRAARAECQKECAEGAPSDIVQLHATSPMKMYPAP